MPFWPGFDILFQSDQGKSPAAGADAAEKGHQMGDNRKNGSRNSRQLMGSGILLLTAIIWGMAFTAQSAGMDYVGPFTLNCARSVLGGLVLLPVIWYGRVKERRKRAGIQREAQPEKWQEAQPGDRGKRQETQPGDREKRQETQPGNRGKRQASEKRRATVSGGICCGIILAIASSLQQIGICYTTVGKAGFITTLYIILVPLMGVFQRRRIQGKVWVSVGLAAMGMYLLCMTDSFTVNPGDAYVFCCAAAYTGHILVIDHFSPRADGVAMSCIQFFICALLCGAAMLLFETPTWENIYAAGIPILYAGVLSSGVGYTLQIVGQKYTEPVVASLIMSLESVFAVLGGWLLLHQTLSGRELAGCAVVFAGIMLIQLPGRRKGVR